MVLTGPMAVAMFDTDEVLAAAKHLVNGDTITIEPCDRIEYFHLLLDGHQLVRADGALSESFHPGHQALTSDAALREELFSLFPELEDTAASALWTLSRPELKSFEARALGRTLQHVQ